MAVHKNLTDLLKVCSVLPVLATLPAMADDYIKQDEIELSGVNNVVDTGVSGIDASVGGGKNFSVMWVKNGVTTVDSGLHFTNNKADSGVFSTSAKSNPKSKLILNPRILFENNVANYDGAAVANFGLMTADGVTFKKNITQIDNVNDATPMGGGAVALGAESETIIKNSIFEQNESKYHGGAIAMRGVTDGDNSAADLDIFDSTFIGNIAAEKGGAIYSTFYDSVTEKESVYIQGSEFSANNAKNGGAVYNEGTPDRVGNKASMKIVDSKFTANSATDEGGAIFNKGNMTVVGSSFANNNVVDGFGGAIKNNGQMTIENSVFEDNIAYSNGAVSTSGKTGSTKISGVTFKDNSALADGGALGLYLDATVTDTVFEDNKSAFGVEVAGTKYDAAKDANGGGALMIGQKATATLKNVKFIDNETGATGGAIHARHHKKDNAYLNLDGAEFIDNEAKINGGAIATIYDGEVNINNAQFVSNSATKNGGAIYNGVDMNYGSSDGTGSLSTDHGTVNFTGENVFRGNVAGINGGAIYNDAGGKIYFEGSNTFEKNTAAGKPNDIYNDGLINIKSGTTSMAAGVKGDGTFSLAKGATLDLGVAQIRQDIINIDGIVNASVLNPKDSEGLRGSYATIVAKSELNVADTAKLNLTVGSVGTYDIFGGRMSGIDIEVGDTYKVSETQDGIVVAIKPVEELAQDTGLNTDTAAVVIGLATTSSPTAQRVSLAAQNALKRGDTVQVEQELAKLNPDDKPVAQSVSTSVQSQVMTLATNRMSGATGTIGRAGGDNANDVSGVWAQGLFNKSKLADQFHGYTRGFAIGADTTIGKDWLLGAGFAYNDSDVHASGRRTDIDGKTLFVYGQYKPTNWFVNGTLAYTMSEYTESVNPFGEYITSDYDVDTYGAQLMTGYDMAYGFTPSIGLRYMHVAQDAYTNTVNSFDSVDTDYLTGVAGLKYAFTIQTNNALKFSPEFRAALTYDFINDDVNTNVVIPGGMGSYQIAAERLSEFGGEFGIGLNMQYRGIDLSLVYDLAIHQDYTSQTGMIKLRSQF